MCDRYALRLALAAVSVGVIACRGEGSPQVVPSVIEVGDPTPLQIEGLPASSYLRTSARELVLGADARVLLGGYEATIAIADGAGLTVTLAQPLAIGTYPLDVHAEAHDWHVENALEVVPVGALVDAGTSSDAPTDAPPDAPRVCPSPPAGCTAFSCATSGSCYYVCAAKVYAAADAQCSAKGIGCLATIDDQAENDCIAAATNPVFPNLVWFGYFQFNNTVEPAGGWDWRCPDGNHFVAPNWGAFEPNDQGGSEDCGAMGAGGAWIDGDCTTSLRYVCEL